VRQPGEYTEAIGDCLRTALRMQAMVEALLSLVRLEAGQVQIQPESIVPDELVRSSWGALEEEARRRKLQVRLTQGATRPVRTDPTLLNLVVGNILENAVVYTNEGGTVEIESSADDSAMHIRVANSGSRIPRDQADMVFERFWRGDAARSEAGVRCGLGLSLVRRAVSVLAGSVEVESGAGGQFEITVSIPDRGGPGDA
jgi:signal transduction histidine kinase